MTLSTEATDATGSANAGAALASEVAQPAFNGNLVEMRVAAHCSCRWRNSVKGAKISEHGKGRAIDISAFVLSDGKESTVAQNCKKLLRRICKAGCGYFTTTLGPGPQWWSLPPPASSCPPVFRQNRSPLLSDRL